ncbi:MAG: hypothetical protein ACK4QL_00155 [Pseudanabaenaceae cyanobacterium]
MAEIEAVKHYVAQWLELGRGIQLGERLLRLSKVRAVQSYTPEFESLWAEVMTNPEQAYLENTLPSIAELATPAWQIDYCPRCHGLISSPTYNYGVVLPCPCADLPDLPNLDALMPHPPVSDRQYLRAVQQKLATRQQENFLPLGTSQRHH